MGKWVLITGASGGIGQSLCWEFCQSGYDVIGLDSKVRDIPDSCKVKLACDLGQLCRDESYRQNILREIEAVFDVSACNFHVLINNAAIQIIKPSTDLTIVDWHQTLDVNLVAPFLLSQALLTRLEASSGSVINIASIHSSLTKPKFVCYATSKAALVGLTRSMAVDLGSRIRVNAICPAAVETPMLSAGFEGDLEAYLKLTQAHPVGRIADPSEIAQTALFLASSKAGFITGTILYVDGGIGSRLHEPL